MRTTLIRTTAVFALLAGALTVPVLQSPAQGQVAQAPAAPPPAGRGGRGGRGPAELWYINKGKVNYAAPMKPLTRLSDLLAAHRGQNNWQQQIISDGLQDVTYNSAAPGTKVTPRMHIETAVSFVVIRGSINFSVEGQQPVTATRGGIVNIKNNTIYSFDVAGAENALWVEIHPFFYKTVTPASAPPPAAEPGKVLTRVSFGHSPAPYTGSNRLYFNLFDALAKCEPVANVVVEDHIVVNPLLGYVNPAENKCNPGQTGNIGSGPLKPGDPPFNPNTTFGHLHQSNIEWWIVQTGQIRGQFEGTGEFHAVEGDVLYAAPDMWHQMAAEAPSGPSVRTAMSAYPITNMGNTAAQP